MIQELTKLCPLAVAGGFVAYWNDNPLYPSDPAAMFRRALAVLITDGGQIYITPVDMTREELDPGAITFYPIARNQFARRSTGALFYKGFFSQPSRKLRNAVSSAQSSAFPSYSQMAVVIKQNQRLRKPPSRS